MDNVYVTGWKGRLGNYLTQKYNLHPMDVDITDKAAVKRFLSVNDVDIIINCAAKTDVDWCETHKKEAYLTNFIGVQNIRDIFSGKIIHLSTDFVFDGRDGLYSEEDAPYPISVYGTTKLLAEGILNPDKDIVVRTTVLYGGSPKPKDFVSFVVSKLAANEYIKLSPFYYTTPTYIPHLAEAIIELTKKEFCGIINIIGKDYVSRYDFGVWIAETFKLDKRLIIPETVKWNVAERPQKAGLSSLLAESINLPIYGLKAGLDDYRSNWER